MPSTLRSFSRLRRAAGTVLAVSLCLAATGAARADESSFRFTFGGFDRLTGSGTLQTDVRSVTGFRAIALKGAMKLVLRQGTREGVELRADSNLLPLIETRVVDRGGVPTLEIGTKRGSSYSTRHEMVATIDLITLSALTISGSGDVVSDALKVPSLRIAITGSGDVRLRQLVADEVSAAISGSGDLEFAGRTGKLAVSISGSGDANTRALEADDVTVSVAGSGDANVTARKTLSVSIAGSGDVVYTGEASVKTAVVGHGSVRKQ